jgi:predicted AAA+ superfamily ATPase
MTRKSFTHRRLHANIWIVAVQLRWTRKTFSPFSSHGSGPHRKTSYTYGVTKKATLETSLTFAKNNTQAQCPLDRAASETLKRLAHTHPITILTGLRGSGKRTLASSLGPTVLVLDDPDLLKAAASHPEPYARGETSRVVLVSNADLARRSAAVARLGDLAAHVTLWPMTRREQKGMGCAGLWGSLFDSPESQWEEIIRTDTTGPEDWRDVVTRGGLPTPALELKTAEERAAWFDKLLQDFVDSDARKFAKESTRAVLASLLKAALRPVGRTVNSLQISREMQMPQTTVYRHLRRLMDRHLLVEIPGYSSLDPRERPVSRSRLYAGDCGLAQHVADASEPHGGQLENLVMLDMRAFVDSTEGSGHISHWRTRSGREIDLLLEWNGSCLPVEVKACAPSFAGATGLMAFRDEHKSSRAGLLLHNGTEVGWIAPGVLCAPWWRVI